MLYQKENSGHSGHHDIRRYCDLEYIPHMHADLELIWLLSGRLEVRVGSRIEEMEAGETALIWPNQIHAYHTVTTNESLVHVFSPDTAEPFLREAGDRIGERAVFRCADWVRDFCLRSCAEESKPTLLSLHASLSAACSEYRRQIPLVVHPRQNDTLFIQILSYIDRHFREDITLNATAAALGYEPHYLSRYFGSVAGINFRQFVNSRRVSEARVLLADRSIPITEAALRSGFQSIRNFNRVFSELEGISPSEYRASGTAQLPEGSRIILT